jgi:hypothetical protein
MSQSAINSVFVAESVKKIHNFLSFGSKAEGIKLFLILESPASHDV